MKALLAQEAKDSQSYQSGIETIVCRCEVLDWLSSQSYQSGIETRVCNQSRRYAQPLNRTKVELKLMSDGVSMRMIFRSQSYQSGIETV